jgi:glycosyltransferase involved in cell wall biosynthesis
MRILNVNMTIDPVTGGGTADRTVKMTRFLHDAGHECAVLTLDIGRPGNRLTDLEGVKVIAAPCLNRRFYIPRISSARIEELVAWSDVVHLMGHWVILNALVYRAIKKLKKPYAVCPAGALTIFGRSTGLKKAYNFVVGKRIIQQADGHIAITPAEIPFFESYGVPGARVRIIPNGIMESEFVAKDDDRFRSDFRLGPEPFILFVGRLNRIKGPDLLVEAFIMAKEALSPYHLVLAGPDEGLLDELQRRVRDAGVDDRVRFLGYVGGEDKSRAYHAADLLVVPSRREAMSIVAVEAGITGTPVLLTDQCGFPEVEEIGGGKVVPADVEGLRQGLSEMLEEPKMLPEMGARLREMVLSRYGPNAIVGRYNDLYNEILDRRRTAPVTGWPLTANHRPGKVECINRKS